jgi:lipid-A-disaccharide synthase-like uncharacterized protein
MPLILQNINNIGGFVLTNVANKGTIIGSLSAIAPSGSLVTTALLTGSVTTSSATSPFSGGGNSYLLPNSSTSYVYVPGQIGYAFGTGDFTIEWFQYETDTNAFPRLFWYGSSPSLGMSFEGSYYLWPSVTALGTKGTVTNAWHHYALVRISSKVYFYKDGTIVNSGGTTNTTNVTDTTSNFVWGARPGGLASEQYGGYLTNIRMVKGLGVYTGNFTVPTSALTAIASANPYGGANTSAIPSGYTKLLLVP